jgi:hypothetical protein
MNKKILFSILVLTLVLFSAPTIGVVIAKQSTEVSGTIELTSVVPAQPPKVAEESDNRVLTMNIIEEWNGGIEGVATAQAIWIVHNAPLIGNPDAWINFHAIITFSDVTVLGQSGGLTIRIRGAKTECHWTIISGTGDLANIHGQGKASLDTEPYTYTGKVHFDP